MVVYPHQMRNVKRPVETSHARPKHGHCPQSWWSRPRVEGKAFLALAEKTCARLGLDRDGTVRLKTQPDGSVVDPNGLEA